MKAAKKPYAAPEMEVVYFETADVISSSEGVPAGISDEDDWGIG